jgi:hypothetical protein
MRVFAPSISVYGRLLITKMTALKNIRRTNSLNAGRIPYPAATPDKRLKDLIRHRPIPDKDLESLIGQIDSPYRWFAVGAGHADAED